MIQFTSKLGMNRGTLRLWLEGKRLMNHGWTKGTRFNVVWNHGTLEYIKDDDGKRAVAGTDTRPIIDTNSKELKTLVAENGVANITMYNDKIIVR